MVFVYAPWTVKMALFYCSLCSVPLPSFRLELTQVTLVGSHLKTINILYIQLSAVINTRSLVTSGGGGGEPSVSKMKFEHICKGRG
jgi:hypothetical protein